MLLVSTTEMIQWIWYDYELPSGVVEYVFDRVNTEESNEWDSSYRVGKVNAWATDEEWRSPSDFDSRNADITSPISMDPSPSCRTTAHLCLYLTCISRTCGLLLTLNRHPCGLLLALLPFAILFRFYLLAFCASLGYHTSSWRWPWISGKYQKLLRYVRSGFLWRILLLCGSAHLFRIELTSPLLLCSSLAWSGEGLWTRFTVCFRGDRVFSRIWSILLVILFVLAACPSWFWLFASCSPLELSEIRGGRSVSLLV